MESRQTVGIPSLYHWGGEGCRKPTGSLPRLYPGEKGGRFIRGDPITKLWVFGVEGTSEDSVVAVSRICPFSSPGHTSRS